jgi:CSLREA domain-containing protein
MADPEGLWIRCWAAITARLARVLSFAIAWSISASRAIARPGLLVALFVALVPLCLMLLQPASKAIGSSTITVNTLGDETTSRDGLCSLREAISNANSPGVDTTGGDCATGTGQDTINFTVSGTITLSSTLPVIVNSSPGSLTIDGNGQAITIDGAHQFGILVVISGATLNLNNLTIANGTPQELGVGGGVNNFGTLNITNSTFSGNSGGTGGGVFNSGALTITNSTFSGNSAGGGGGVLNAGSPIVGGVNGTVTVTNSTFSGNSASGGGAGGGILNIFWYADYHQQHVLRQHGGSGQRRRRF